MDEPSMEMAIDVDEDEADRLLCTMSAVHMRQIRADDQWVRIPFSLEIDETIPPNMPQPMYVAEQITADVIASGQMRMHSWELLCDCLPPGELRREASMEGSTECSGACSQGPLYGLRRNTTSFP